MTISSTTRKTALATGNGSTTSYAFTFKVQDSDDIVVYTLEDGVETAATTGFTVTLNANQNTNPGGSVLFDTAPTADQDFVITTDADPTQEQDIQNQAAFNPAIVMEALDKLTILVQQLAGKASRALKLRITDTSDNDDLVPETGKALGWGVGGWTWLSNLATTTVSSFMEAPLLSATAHAFAKAVDGTMTVTTYAAFRALSGKAANVVYHIRGRASDRDGGEGAFVYVPGASATDDGGTILTDASGAGYRLDADTINPRWFASELGAAMTAAAAAMSATYGRIQLPPRSYTASTQMVFPRTKNFYVVGMEGCRVAVTYTGGSSIKIGDGTALTQLCVFKGHGTYIDQANNVNQALFETRGCRGFYTYGFRGAGLYQVHKWGDGADAQQCFQWWHTACEWNMRPNSNGGHDHIINANGSGGGYYEHDCSIEGDSERVVADKAVFYLDSNQGSARFDHFVRSGLSIWKYCDYGLYAYNARIVNVDIAASTRVDDMGKWAVRILTDNTGVKGGVEGMCWRGVFGGGHEGGGVWLSNESGPAVGVFQNVTVHGMETANLVDDFFKATTTGTGVMKQLHIADNHLSDYNARSNTTNCITFDGDITESSIRGNTMDRKSGSTYTPAYLIYNNTASTKSIWITADNTTIDANTGVVYDPNIGDMSIKRFCAINTDGTPRGRYPIQFAQTDFATSQTNVAMNVYDATGVAVAYARVLRRGRITGLSVSLNASVAAGSLTIGAATGATIDTNLDIVMTSGDGNVVEYAAGSAALAAGDKVYARYTSDGSLTASIDGTATIWVQEM